MSSPILYQNHTKTIVLIDVPLSLEHAQGHPSPGRLLSSTPLQTPYPSLKPKSKKAKANLPDVFIDELLLVRHLELALDEVRREHRGKWCEERVTEDGNGDGKKRKLNEDDDNKDLQGEQSNEADVQEVDIFFQNTTATSTGISINPSQPKVTIPSKATVLQGPIAQTIEIFNASAPAFDLVLLDPPWPNRSARRKGSYSISWGNAEIQNLLLSIPLQDRLNEGAFVGVWITNRPAFREMLVGEDGLFREWGISLTEEWIWVKVTENGEPICDLDSTWRKPYEVLLVARKGLDPREEVKPTRRVMVSVPDVHSRKPNLKLLFEDVMGKKEGEYEALEIFARNLTNGWWSWGNEALKFQTQDHWVKP